MCAHLANTAASVFCANIFRSALQIIEGTCTDNRHYSITEIQFKTDTRRNEGPARKLTNYEEKGRHERWMVTIALVIRTSHSILECEFYLLELMDCCLIVYHPYRPLLQYVQDMGQEDMLLPLAWSLSHISPGTGPEAAACNGAVRGAWRIVNDTYRTDLCLLYPPFMIALACLHVACVVQQKDARQWFAELSVDMEKILEIIRVILKLYEQWKNFDERKEMAAILGKMPKPKPPPNRDSAGPSADQIQGVFMQVEMLDPCFWSHFVMESGGEQQQLPDEVRQKPKQKDRGDQPSRKSSSEQGSRASTKETPRIPVLYFGARVAEESVTPTNLREMIRLEVRESLRSLSQAEGSKHRTLLDSNSSEEEREENSYLSSPLSSSSDEESGRFCLPLDKID
ncbi:unnamed protein product [Ranitomeya imitator]|uniref:Cyclin C-terminal domain-containing protein n=1 Tax=Ranitomeya imitator TaxID=111125 RepID=A0ABN9MC12_9NEOB|nr:unnamed protein product [Ranitomeya imitator]